MVLTAMRGKTRGRIQIGADDPSLTAAGGMLAVTELCERLGLIAALDEGMGPVKQRQARVHRRAGAGRDGRRAAGRGGLPGGPGPGPRRPGRAAGDTGALAGRDRHGQRAGRRLAVPARRLARQHGAADPPGQAGPDQVSADPRSRRRRTLHPDQRAMLFPELEQQPAIYAYSFICTNLDCSTPAKAAAVEHWYRHRTSAENIFRDSKHGAALRHLPSGHEQVNTAWMWASLIAAAIAAWLHQLTGLIQGGELVEGHGTRGGKAMIATLRRVLIAVPARLVRHGGQLLMRLAPGEHLLPGILAAIRALPTPPASRRRPAPPASHAFEAPVPAKRPPGRRTSERPRTREPGATPGSLPCPHARRPHSKIIHLPVDNVRRSTRGFGSEHWKRVGVVRHEHAGPGLAAGVRFRARRHCEHGAARCRSGRDAPARLHRRARRPAAARVGRLAAR